MIEAVENHMPEVIIIDEIGTELEAGAARTIAERGVQLIATAHGKTLDNLILNPTLSDLVGGIESVTLGDDEARRRGTQKAILERRAPPTFDILVEIIGFDSVAIHHDVSEIVDAILRGSQVVPELRDLTADGQIKVTRQAEQPVAGRVGGRVSRNAAQTLPFGAAPATPPQPARRRAIYPFGIARNRLEQALRETRFSADVVDSLVSADAVMTMRSYFRRKPQTLRDAEERGIPVYVVKSNTVFQLEQCLLSMRNERAGDPVLGALKEAEEAIGKVLTNELATDLMPQNAYVRRLQHMLAQRYNLVSRSLGRDPERYVRIFPSGSD